MRLITPRCVSAVPEAQVGLVDERVCFRTSGSDDSSQPEPVGQITKGLVLLRGQAVELVGRSWRSRRTAGGPSACIFAHVAASAPRKFVDNTPKSLSRVTDRPWHRENAVN